MSLFSTVGSDGLDDEAAPPIPAQTKRGTRTMGHASRTMTAPAAAPLAVPEPKPTHPVVHKIQTAAATNALPPQFTHMVGRPDTSDLKKQWPAVLIAGLLYLLIGAICGVWYLLSLALWTGLHAVMWVNATKGRTFIAGIAGAAATWYLHSRGIL
jgi:hypothetical protein